MRILSFDLGTTTGYAFMSDAPPELNSSSITFKISRFEGGGMRFLRFRQFLDQFPHRPDLVTYEAVRRHKGVDAAHVYGGLQATLTAWCEQNNIPYEGVPVQHIKKFATGKGNASKADMIAAAADIGFVGKDDNEVDAFFLCSFSMQQFKGVSA